MKERPIKIRNVADVVALNRYVRKNHIRGKVVQNNYEANARNFLWLLMALPLDSATLYINE